MQFLEREYVSSLTEHSDMFHVLVKWLDQLTILLPKLESFYNQLILYKVSNKKYLIHLKRQPISAITFYTLNHRSTYHDFLHTLNHPFILKREHRKALRFV